MPEDKDDQIAIKQLNIIMMAVISEPVAWHLVDAEYSVFTGKDHVQIPSGHFTIHHV